MSQISDMQSIDLFFMLILKLGLISTEGYVDAWRRSPNAYIRYLKDGRL